jgi:hypothetical protein
MTNRYRADVFGKHVRESRGSTDPTVVKRNLNLMLDARKLIPDDAEFDAWAQAHGIRDLVDSDFFKAIWEYRQEEQRQAETNRQPASPPRSVEPEPPRRPRPVQPPQGAYRVDFDQHAAREDAGGRFAAANTFVAQGEIVRYPRQPANSPWHHDPVGDEPTINFEATTRVLGNEQPAAPVTAPVERAPREDDWLGDIDRLLEVIEEQRAENKEQRAEINRLKAELKSQSSGAAPVQTPSVESTLDEGEPLLASAASPHNSSPPPTMGTAETEK